LALASLAQTALRSADRGARLTQQLLAFARRQALRPAVADLNILLTEIEELLRRTVGETIDLILECSPDLSRCEVDSAQFEAAVMNFVINARDAMPKGGCLTVKTANVESRDLPVYLDLRPGDYVALSVGDNGDGVTPEVLARAFEPFYTTKEVGKGSGLGLSMVYGFAKQSGGGVRLDSTPGLGTCVTLYLPRASPPSEASNEAGSVVEPRRRCGSILVVEDDEDVREVSVAMLEELGHRVCVARDAREALSSLRRPDRIDLLFTDLAMPGACQDWRWRARRS
jgi:signal transduction histidine kinase